MIGVILLKKIFPDDIAYTIYSFVIDEEIIIKKYMINIYLDSGISYYCLNNINNSIVNIGPQYDLLSELPRLKKIVNILKYFKKFDKILYYNLIIENQILMQLKTYVYILKKYNSSNIIKLNNLIDKYISFIEENYLNKYNYI